MAWPPLVGAATEVDRDRDTVLDHIDNCPNLPNLDQRDSNGDGVGDACDTQKVLAILQYTWVIWLVAFGLALVLAAIFVITSRALTKISNELEREEEEAAEKKKRVEDR